jgi:hypothetical protein
MSSTEVASSSPDVPSIQISKTPQDSNIIPIKNNNNNINMEGNINELNIESQLEPEESRNESSSTSSSSSSSTKSTNDKQNHQETPFNEESSQRTVTSISLVETPDKNHVELDLDHSKEEPKEDEKEESNDDQEQERRLDSVQDETTTTVLESQQELPLPNQNIISTSPSSDSTSSFHTSSSTASTLRENERSQLKKHYETLLKRQQKQHEEQIDEIIESLNSLETTYGKEIANLKDKLSKKEVMTEALTNSLSDMRNQNMALKSDLTTSEVKYTQLSKIHNLAIAELESVKVEYDKIVKEKEVIIQRANEEKLEAVRNAQDEIRCAAESQFASANQTYVKLKQDYTNLLKEKEVMSTEMAVCKKKLETKDRDSEAKISNYMAELADARANLATAEADAIKMEQKLKGQLMGLHDQYKEMEMKLGQEGKNHEEMQRMIDDTIREKDILVKENHELQALCEELMGIVEGNTGTASK